MSTYDLSLAILKLAVVHSSDGAFA